MNVEHRRRCCVGWHGVLAGAAAGAIAVNAMDANRGPAAQPEAGDWLNYRRTYDVTGFSPLRQIDRTNVRQLRPV
jgi:glucose dehydrogenase